MDGERFAGYFSHPSHGSVALATGGIDMTFYYIYVNFKKVFW